MKENTSLLAKNKKKSFTLEQDVNPPKRLRKALKYLYVSHTFAKASERAWEFCVILFLSAFTNYESLLLVSTYWSVSYLLMCFLGGKVGQFVDNHGRYEVLRWFIQLQNGSVILATWCCYELLPMASKSVDDDLTGDTLHGFPISWYSIFLIIALHIFGPIAGVLDKGLTVAIERDWVVVMSKVAGEMFVTSPSFNDIEILNDKEEKNNDENMNTLTNINLSSLENMENRKNNAIKKCLSDANVFMKQIDLACKALAPAFAGFFIAFYGKDGSLNEPNHSQSKSTSAKDLQGAAILIGLLNVACLIVEYIFTTKIYYLIPELSEKKHKTRKHDDPQQECFNLNILSGLNVFMNQSVSLTGIAMSLLYLNVLTFGGLMTAYLVWRGMRIEVIGIWRGLSACIGLSGTRVFSISSSRISLESTGLWSISYQFSCLTVSYISLFIHQYNLSIGMLIGGVCASRVGLWVFDITITQLMQENVPEKVRGTVGGVQQSLNSFFGLGAYAIGILKPNPNQFFILVGTGYFSVGIALCIYGFWYCKKYH